MVNVLFYNDSDIFGGHEVMTAKVINCLTHRENINVGVVYYGQNLRFYKELSVINQEVRPISLFSVKVKSKKFQILRTLVSPLKIWSIMKLIRKFNADIVIISQGSIGSCTIGLVAAKLLGVRTISYIPLVPNVSLHNKVIGSSLKECLNTFYYRLPDQYITVSYGIKKKIVKQGISSRISVVYNGIDLSKYLFRDKVASRSIYGIEDGNFVMGIIGRVKFTHKAHDLLIRAIAQNLQKLIGIKLVIVGDGQDLDKLKKMVYLNKIDELISFIPWTNDLSYIYSAIDMLLIPSWFEGFPLVMIEAMYYGIPIVASNVDGMAEILPPEWLFKVGDSSSLIEKILFVKNSCNDQNIIKNKTRVIQEFNLDKFCENIMRAIFDDSQCS